LASRSRAVLLTAVLLALLTACGSTPSNGLAVRHPGSPTVHPTGRAKPKPTKPKPKPTQTRATVRSVQHGSGPAGAYISTGSRGVAITFDDGPDPIYTPQVLDLLRRYRVKATFCLVGWRVREHPDLVRRIAAEGHTLCNHSWQHLLDLGADSHTDASILGDLRATNNAIRAAVPSAKIKYFRAPGGNFSPRLVNLAASLGMKSIYWAVDPQDWNSAKYGRGPAMVSHIVTTVEHNTWPGAIILSHDMDTPDTVTAYRTLMPWLKRRFSLIRLPI
jgi:peptidoglycan-N-acetylglucosamine deacetylase